MWCVDSACGHGCVFCFRGIAGAAGIAGQAGYRWRKAGSTWRSYRRELRGAKVWRAFRDAAANGWETLPSRRFSSTGTMQKYGEWSDRIATILAKFSPIVEMVSIDEAYLDLAGTERLHGPPLAAADKLLAHDHAPLPELPCSGGLADHAARWRRWHRNRLSRAAWFGLRRGSEMRFLAPLPVRKIPGHRRGDGTRVARSGNRNRGTACGRFRRSDSKKFSGSGATRCTAKRVAAIRTNL